MSDTMISAIVGAVIGGIVSGLATYLITMSQWKRERKEQRSVLRDLILTDLMGSLSSTAVKYVKDKAYIQELEKKSLNRIRFLSIKGQAEKNVGLREASDRLAPLMQGYFLMLEQFSVGKVTQVDMEAYRTKIKNQVGDILGTI